jgi:hypothetical protein
MKQTAVEWLVETITKKHDKHFSTFYGAEIEQANQMFEEQIRRAFCHGEVARDRIDSIEYYNETYGK